MKTLIDKADEIRANSPRGTAHAGASPRIVSVNTEETKELKDKRPPHERSAFDE